MSEDIKQTKNAKPETAAAVEAPAAPATRRVILQRPVGVTDTHQWIGYNDFGMQVQYDVPVELPEAVVAHLRGCKAVEYRADEKGRPVPSYGVAFNVVDAA